MQRKIAVVLLAMMIIFSSATCNRQQQNSTVYKGRLEVKGICMNYTITMLENVDDKLVQKTWTDEVTGKTYTNAFGLESICSFPADINEGESFYFILDPSAKKDCARCMAFYPTPEKKLSIKVIPAPVN